MFNLFIMYGIYNKKCDIKSVNKFYSLGYYNSLNIYLSIKLSIAVINKGTVNGSEDKIYQFPYYTKLKWNSDQLI